VSLKLFVAGAEVILLCTNTMHKVSQPIEKYFKSNFIHIADATGTYIKQYGLQKVGLLGTGFTMNEHFYKERLKDRFDIEVMIPEQHDIKEIHKIIYNQLIKGSIVSESKAYFIQVAKIMESRGAEGIILGCTEIPMLLQEDDSPLPLFDTMQIHSLAALNAAMH
jgi:aspartate racemase